MTPPTDLAGRLRAVPRPAAVTASATLPDVMRGQDAPIRALGPDGAKRVLPPWRNGSTTLHRGEVEVVGRIHVDVPATLAVEVVQNIGGIDAYEVKVDAVEVNPLSETTGEYYLKGRAAAVLPWEGAFIYELTERGFHSRTANGPVSNGVDVSGGFDVRQLPAGGAVVVHYEHYLLPLHFAWAAGPHRAYIRRSMKTELRDIRRLLRFLYRHTPRR